MSTRSVKTTINSTDTFKSRVAVKKMAKNTSRRTQTTEKMRWAMGIRSCIKYDVPTFSRIITSAETYALEENTCDKVVKSSSWEMSIVESSFVYYR